MFVLEGLLQKILAGGASRRLGATARTLVGSIAHGDLVLDLGCGFATPLAAAGIAPIGVDIDEQRTRSLASRGSRALVADAVALPFPDGIFTSVFSFGLLHHLNDENARRVIDEVLRVVQPNGLIAVFDGITPRLGWRQPLPMLIRAADRGRHMRCESQLKGLFDGLSGWAFKRITYAITGLEGVWCVHSPGHA